MKLNFEEFIPGNVIVNVTFGFAKAFGGITARQKEISEISSIVAKSSNVPSRTIVHKRVRGNPSPRLIQIFLVHRLIQNLNRPFFSYRSYQRPKDI